MTAAFDWALAARDDRLADHYMSGCCTTCHGPEEHRAWCREWREQSADADRNDRKDELESWL